MFCAAVILHLIIEFKFDNGKELSKEALAQIKSKAYSEKFHIEKKDIIMIGISFDKQTRKINNYLKEEISAHTSES